MEPSELVGKHEDLWIDSATGEVWLHVDVNLAKCILELHEEHKQSHADKVDKYGFPDRELSLSETVSHTLRVADRYRGD